MDKAETERLSEDINRQLLEQRREQVARETRAAIDELRRMVAALSEIFQTSFVPALERIEDALKSGKAERSKARE